MQAVQSENAFTVSRRCAIIATVQKLENEKIFDNSILVKVLAFVLLGRASCGLPSGWWACAYRMQQVCQVPNKQS